MRIASNTSPLIFLTKIGRLSFLEGHQVIIPEQVLDEIRAWEKIDSENYQRLAAWIGKNKISVEKVTVTTDFPQSLGKGEKAAICLAMQNKAQAILIDEKKGRVAAKAAGLTPVGTVAIIQQQMLDKKITHKECKNLVLELIKKGYRIKEELLAEFLQDLESKK